MRKGFLIFILFISFMAYGQEKLVSLQWGDKESSLHFENAVNNEKWGELPIYSDVFPWPYDDKIPNVTVEIEESRVLHNLPEGFDFKSIRHNAPPYGLNLSFENRKPLVQFDLVPLFYNKETGNIEQVISFRYKIEPTTPMAGLKSQKRGHFINHSLLAENDWYKIAVKNSGIHKLTYEDLIAIGLENPAQAKIYGAGAIYLPENYSWGYYDDLKEVPIYINKGGDQLFGPGDYILFYVNGIVKWEYDDYSDFFNQEIHPHSRVGYYFLTDDLGNPSLPANALLTTDEPDAVVNSYDILAFHEEEKYNLLNSGKEWYGDHYSLTLSGAYPFSLPGLKTSEPVQVRVAAALRSNETSSVRVTANSRNLGLLTSNPVNLSNYASTYAIEEMQVFSYNPVSSVFTIGVEYLQPNTNSEAWLNYITINARAALRFESDQLQFRDARSAGFGKEAEFRLSTSISNVIIWDITDPNKPANIPYTLSGGNAVFKVRTDSVREFIAFDPSGTFETPVIEGPGLGKVENQNLHGTAPHDMIIIYPEIFKDQSGRLAEHRRENDNLDVLMVTQEEIFNEFSSGTPDVSAIRNYLKMYYDNYSAEEMPDYLLLFGDGSYDNRDTATDNPNIILTYQSDNSLTPTGSYVSDDFFGLLDTGERLYDGLLDIGIGRLPVSTTEEAEVVVDKIIEYDQTKTLGEWRNYICLIGDDEDGNIHMKQANSLADYIESNYPGYNVNRIFIDAYPQETTPTGDRYPEVTRAINDQVKRGALILNYTGHGGVTGLAHEKILDVNNIKGWNNKGKYPLFMTATCEFSRYDEYNLSKKSEVSSAGEEVLLNPSGGSIALFTTTRLVYSRPNHVLNEKFYQIVFKKKENGECYRLGDIIAYSKNNAGVGINKRNFTLLGDPATTLSFPLNVVATDSVNHVAVGQNTDTLSALDFVTVSGHIEDRQGNLMNDFNGTVVPVVYDKKTELKTLANDGGNPMDFNTRSSILYKGNVTAQKGRFSFSFYVPKDIGYNIGGGKISYYSDNGLTDAHGATDDITIGGLGEFNITDTTGPSISVFMNDSLFRNGGIVDNSPELLVYIKDPYGVNTTGNGIGHDLKATLNSDRLNAITLNNYYVADKDSYSSGTVRYPYSGLENGKHTIEVKVWDIFNNSATETIDFVVVESAEMLLKEIYNYPNPFVDQTWFNIEHNRPGQELEVIIKIYDMFGGIVSVIQDQIYSDGYRINPPSWQGKSMGGATLSGGLYVYKVFVRNDDGEEAVGSGRLLISR